MALWIDTQFLKQISYRLPGYKEKKLGDQFLANCKCPICGDSEKRNKKRGYFFVYKNSLVFKCHNCNTSMGFSTFLKDFDPNLYDRYRLEKFKLDQHEYTPEPTKAEPSPPPSTKKYVPDITEGLKSIDQLSKTHPVRAYIESRRIPAMFWPTLFYAPKFYEWTTGHTDKFSIYKSFTDHPRLIIPWYSSDGVVFAYTARSFGDEEPKYYKIIIDDSYPPFFGMDRVKTPKYVVEGPIDSLFLPDCIAVGTSSLHMYDGDATYITDRDVRNVEVMREVRRLIHKGKRVCMLPDGLPGKDINDFIKNNLSSEDIVNIIETNTYQGLAAELHFVSWKKTSVLEEVANKKKFNKGDKNGKALQV